MDLIQLVITYKINNEKYFCGDGIHSDLCTFKPFVKHITMMVEGGVDFNK